MVDASIPVVDLHTSAGELAIRLSFMHQFLDAARQLLCTCGHMPCGDYRTHGRKIVTLIEIAQKTLIHSGLKLHAFVSCRPTFVPCKSVYFSLLRILRRHRHDLPIELNGRTQRLLLPLSSQFVIRTRNPSADASGASLPPELGCHPRQCHALVMSCKSAVDTATSRFQAVTSAPLMPPPGASPSKIERSIDYSLGRRESRNGLEIISVVPTVRSQNVRRNPSKTPEVNQENILPGAFIRQPSRRHFGIFCTAQRPSYPKKRVGRSMSVRSVGRE